MREWRKPYFRDWYFKVCLHGDDIEGTVYVANGKTENKD